MLRVTPILSHLIWLIQCAKYCVHKTNCFSLLFSLFLSILSFRLWIWMKMGGTFVQWRHIAYTAICYPLKWLCMLERKYWAKSLRTNRYGTSLRQITMENHYTTRVMFYSAARCGAVGWGTALQAGRSRVRFPIRPLRFFFDVIRRVDSGSNRNEYQKYFLEGKGGWCEGLTNLPPSCADCIEIWEPQTPGALTACPGLLQGLLCLYLITLYYILSHFGRRSDRNIYQWKLIYDE